MPSMTRRRALQALPALALGLAGCSSVGGGREPLPVERSWYTKLTDSTPVVAAGDGSLLVGSHGPFRDDPIVAGLDGGTGELAWSVSVDKGRKSPIGTADGRAYAFSKSETVLAVDAATGGTVWRRPLAPVDEADPGVTEFPPVPVGDRVVVPVSGTEDDVPDRLVGLAADDGETQFTYRLEASLSGAPGRTAGLVVVPTVDGRLLAVGPDGRTEWTLDVGASMSAVAAADGTVYVGSAAEELLAVDVTDGTVDWRGELRNTAFARPLVTDDRVYVGGADYVLRAFDRGSGDQLWRDPLANAVTHGPALLGGRLVTLVGGDHRVRGPAGEVPFSPVELYVHETDGTRVRAARFEGVLEGGSVEWASVVGGGLYLGQTFGVSRVATEAITDA